MRVTCMAIINQCHACPSPICLQRKGLHAWILGCLDACILCMDSVMSNLWLLSFSYQTFTCKIRSWYHVRYIQYHITFMTSSSIKKEKYFKYSFHRNKQRVWWVCAPEIITSYVTGRMNIDNPENKIKLWVGYLHLFPFPLLIHIQPQINKTKDIVQNNKNTCTQFKKECLNYQALTPITRT